MVVKLDDRSMVEVVDGLEEAHRGGIATGAAVNLVQLLRGLLLPWVVCLKKVVIVIFGAWRRDDFKYCKCILCNLVRPVIRYHPSSKHFVVISIYFYLQFKSSSHLRPPLC